MPKSCAISGLITFLGLLFCLGAAEGFAGQSLTIDAQQQYQYAERLNREGQFRRAADEYDRFAYFFPDNALHRIALFKAAEAYYHAGERTTALHRFNRLIQTNLLDTVATESYFMLARCYLASQDSGQAILQMHNLITLSDDVQVKDRAYNFIGWIYIDQMAWADARKAFERVTASGRRQAQLDQLVRALDEASGIPRKNPSLAGALSIFPGAGQLYCGRYEDALAAFLVNGALAWASYESFDNDLYALGGLLAFVGLGFYTGNIYGAISSAHKFNMAQRQAYSERLRQRYLQERPLGRQFKDPDSPPIVLGFRLNF